MLDYSPTPEQLIAMNDINEFNSIHLHNRRFFPIAYHVLARLYHGSMGIERLVIVVDHAVWVPNFTSLIYDRLVMDNIDIFYDDVDSISLTEGSSLEVFCVRQLMDNGIPDSTDEVSAYFFALQSDYSSRVYEDIFASCLESSNESIPTRDLFIGVRTKLLLDNI